jgi:pyruvate/2-oxoglutarate dehydrogenase complex dihydrolipoamide acyltransferase (E2) component
MHNIRVDGALWASSMLPEGIFEKWLVADGAVVAAGDPLAEVRIEEGLHEILSPSGGRLTTIAAQNDVIEPGCLVATVRTIES